MPQEARDHCRAFDQSDQSETPSTARTGERRGSQHAVIVMENQVDGQARRGCRQQPQQLRLLSQLSCAAPPGEKCPALCQQGWSNSALIAPIVSQPHVSLPAY